MVGVGNAFEEVCICRRTEVVWFFSLNVYESVLREWSAATRWCVLFEYLDRTVIDYLTGCLFSACYHSLVQLSVSLLNYFSCCVTDHP